MISGLSLLLISGDRMPVHYLLERDYQRTEYAPEDGLQLQIDGRDASQQPLPVVLRC